MKTHNTLALRQQGSKTSYERVSIWDIFIQGAEQAMGNEDKDRERWKEAHLHFVGWQQCLLRELFESPVHVKPFDIGNCERGVKELTCIEEELLKEKITTEKSYAELFSDNGQHCNIWAKEQRQYYETLITNLLSLLGAITNAKRTMPLPKLH